MERWLAVTTNSASMNGFICVVLVLPLLPSRGHGIVMIARPNDRSTTREPGPVNVVPAPVMVLQLLTVMQDLDEVVREICVLYITYDGYKFISVM